MLKKFIIDYSKCSGCRTCEMVCSLVHYGICSPSLSRINIMKWELKGIYVPIVCHHCEDRPCVSVCPTNAICSIDNGLVKIDLRKCIGCGNCAVACPFGAISFDPTTRKVKSCDLCNGQPVCVKVCPTEALVYAEWDRINQKLRNKIVDFIDLTNE